MTMAAPFESKMLRFPADIAMRLLTCDIVFVIDAAKGAGVEKVGIVTEGMRRAAAGCE